MLLGAVVAMVLAAAVPALAQTVTQIGDNNIACVQTAVQQNIVSQGNGNAQANESGDNIIANSNVNSQAIAQECNITVEQVNTIAKKFLTVNKKAGKKAVIVKTASATASAKTASATASASAPAKVQYKKKAVVVKTASATASASASAAAPVQYQYKAAAATPKAAAELPDTGGTSLLAIGAMVLLLGGGLTAL